jgi:hypothetical protein
MTPDQRLAETCAAGAEAARRDVVLRVKPAELQARILQPYRESQQEDDAA